MDQRAFNILYFAYLEHSIRYYEEDDPVISDHLFDRLCQALLRHWHSYEHSLKHLTSAEDLRAGTGHQLHDRPELGRLRTMLRYNGRVPMSEVPNPKETQ